MVVSRCACGIPVGKRTSWTSDNPGRKFVACKFFNHETGQRGCNTFEWIDEEGSEWQRDVINVLVAEKHRLATDNALLKSRLACDGYEKHRVEQELQKLKSKAVKKVHSSPPFVRDSVVSNEESVVAQLDDVVDQRPVGRSSEKLVVVSAVVSAVISFLIMKLFG